MGAVVWMVVNPPRGIHDGSTSKFLLALRAHAIMVARGKQIVALGTVMGGLDGVVWKLRQAKV